MYFLFYIVVDLYHEFFQLDVLICPAYVITLYYCSPRLGSNSYLFVMTTNYTSTMSLKSISTVINSSLIPSQVDRLPLTFEGGPQLSLQHNLPAKCKWSYEKLVPKSELV